MWAPLVVEGDPFSDHPQCVGLALKAMPVHALLLQGSDHTLDHPVLLWAVRGDELLLQPIAAHQPGVVATGEHQAVVRAKQEGLLHASQRAVARDQSLLQGGRSGAGLAGLQTLLADAIA